MDKKKTILILGMFAIISMFFGGTLAYWTWTTSTEQQTNVVFTVTKDFECAADGGGNITSEQVSLVPTDCTNSTYAIKREIKVTPTIYDTELSIDMNLWLDINSIGTGLSDSVNFKYALTTSSNSCTEGVIFKGNFNGKITNDTVKIFNSNYSTSTTETYYLYIWLDSAETSSSTMNQTFDLSLNGSCENAPYISPEAPILDEGMIPVTIATDGTVTTISEDDKNWYNYENKEWANMVLVNSDSRSSYLGTTGKTIPSDDILAYYVWIPRYKYNIWTTTASKAGNEQTIDIKFESKDSAITIGTNVGDYHTHPAFWWDDNNNETVDEGEMLAGIWVGKFETSTYSSSTCYTSASESNCNNINQTPMILPNVSSLRYQTISNQFQTSLKFSGGTFDTSSGEITFTGNDTYGLTNLTDSHMMKNSDWGAVAYLSHSKYGINDEIRINNNNSSYITGCGALDKNNNSVSTCQIAYGNVIKYPQSTTGNITGIFDMSGGADEYVMHVLSTSYPLSSGFTTFPEIRYYDTPDNQLGQALYETINWYNNTHNPVYDYNPWLRRGGRSGLSDSGIFWDWNGPGAGLWLTTWRSILVIK